MKNQNRVLENGSRKNPVAQSRKSTAAAGLTPIHQLSEWQKQLQKLEIKSVKAYALFDLLAIYEEVKDNEGPNIGTHASRMVQGIYELRSEVAEDLMEAVEGILAHPNGFAG